MCPVFTGGCVCLGKGGGGGCACVRVGVGKRGEFGRDVLKRKI